MRSDGPQTMSNLTFVAVILLASCCFICAAAPPLTKPGLAVGPQANGKDRSDSTSNESSASTDTPKATASSTASAEASVESLQNSSDTSGELDSRETTTPSVVSLGSDSPSVNNTLIDGGNSTENSTDSREEPETSLDIDTANNSTESAETAQGKNGTDFDSGVDLWDDFMLDSNDTDSGSQELSDDKNSTASGIDVWDDFVLNKTDTASTGDTSDESDQARNGTGSGQDVWDDFVLDTNETASAGSTSREVGQASNGTQSGVDVWDDFILNKTETEKKGDSSRDLSEDENVTESLSDLLDDFILKKNESDSKDETSQDLTQDGHGSESLSDILDDFILAKNVTQEKDNSSDEVTVDRNVTETNNDMWEKFVLDKSEDGDDLLSDRNVTDTDSADRDELVQERNITSRDRDDLDDVASFVTVPQSDAMDGPASVHGSTLRDSDEQDDMGEAKNKTGGKNDDDDDNDDLLEDRNMTRSRDSDDPDGFDAADKDSDMVPGDVADDVRQDVVGDVTDDASEVTDDVLGDDIMDDDGSRSGNMSSTERQNVTSAEDTLEEWEEDSFLEMLGRGTTDTANDDRDAKDKDKKDDDSKNKSGEDLDDVTSSETDVTGATDATTSEEDHDDDCVDDDDVVDADDGDSSVEKGKCGKMKGSRVKKLLKKAEGELTNKDQGDKETVQSAASFLISAMNLSSTVQTPEDLDFASKGVIQRSLRNTVKVINKAGSDAKISQQLIMAVDDFSASVLNTFSLSGADNIVDEMFQLMVTDLTREHRPYEGETGISVIPSDEVKSGNLIIVVLNHTRGPKSESADRTYHATPTVSLNLQRHLTLRKPFIIVFNVSYDPAKFIPSCVFLEKTGNDSYNWSTAGVVTSSEPNRSRVTCEAYHLTSFAVIMQPVFIEVSEIEKAVLSMVSTICSGVSIAALFLSFILIITVKGNGDRIYLLKHLVIVLLLAHILFIVGIERTEIMDVCRGIAIGLHYLLLSMLLWMLAQGVELHVRVNDVFHQKRYWIEYTVAAYVIPAIIVGVSLLLEYDQYGFEEYCWLSPKGHLIFAFIGPAVLVILVNVLVLVLVLKAFNKVKVNAKKTDRQKLKANIRACIVLLPILGPTWIVGVFAVNTHTLFFQYIFNVLTALQGVFILVFHGLLNEEVMSVWQKRLKRYQANRVGAFKSMPRNGRFQGSNTDQAWISSIRSPNKHEEAMKANGKHMGKDAVC